MTLIARTIRIGRAALAITLLAPGCSSFLTKQSTTSYVIIDSLQASTGREPDKVAGSLASDVVTYVKKDNGSGQQVLLPFIFSDNFIATFSLAMKDPGTVESPNAPSANNSITLTRYHVKFIRSDGRNTEGVDVPYAFDGAMTVTVGATGAKGAAILVRSQAKTEAPLATYVNFNGPSLSTIAEVTFYGKDQTGRDVTVVGKIGVHFADFGDPS